MWKNGQAAAGYLRVRSPRLHDAVQGIRSQAPIANTQPLLPWGFAQQLVAQDTLSIDVAGSNTAGDIENASLLVYYENLDGANGLFIDLAELERRMVHVFSVTHALVGATSGAWGTAQAISAGTGDLMKANTYYALLGYTSSESASPNACSFGITGPDTGNLRLGGPISNIDPNLTADWFTYLTKRFKTPLIPVINSANKGGTFLDVLNNENANTATVSTIWAQLV
jgi:hypothetical protein